MKRKKQYYEPTTYRQEAKKAAEELMYGSDVVERIMKAKDDVEIGKIMMEARRKKFKMNPGADERF